MLVAFITILVSAGAAGGEEVDVECGDGTRTGTATAAGLTVIAGPQASFVLRALLGGEGVSLREFCGGESRSVWPGKLPRDACCTSAERASMLCSFSESEGLLLAEDTAFL